MTEKIITDYRAIRANKIATELKRHRVPVRYLTLIDSPRNLVAPSGVRCHVFRQWRKDAKKSPPLQQVICKSVTMLKAIR